MSSDATTPLNIALFTPTHLKPKFSHYLSFFLSFSLYTRRRGTDTWRERQRDRGQQLVLPFSAPLFSLSPLLGFPILTRRPLLSPSLPLQLSSLSLSLSREEEEEEEEDDDEEEVEKKDMRIAELVSSSLPATTTTTSYTCHTLRRRSPLTSSPFSHRPNNYDFVLSIRAISGNPSAKSNNLPPARTIGKTLEPPWLVLPPPPPENPFSGQQLPLLKKVGTGIPFSLRLVQMKKRLSHPATSLSLDFPPESPPVSRAVSALLFMIEELQKPVLASDDGGAEGMTIDRVCRDRRDCFSWLFRRVFANSPNLVPLILLLLSSFIANSSERITAGEELGGTHLATGAELREGSPPGSASSGGSEADVVSAVSPEICLEKPVIGSFDTWFDIGIKEGGPTYRRMEEETSEDRRRRAYERAIAGGEINPLILCNYAQFLYQIAHDHDRAEQYFQWAAVAEPKDAEAVSKYAFFLWEERGDVSKAEELFLEAIDIDQGSFYHSSNYAWFLWKTGAEDTCFPLSPPPPLSC